jgi:oxidoreductase
VLKELLSSSHFTRVGEYGRRVTEAKDLTAGKEKLEQKVVDFENLQPGAWKDGKWDVVFITYVTSSSPPLLPNLLIHPSS